MAKPIIESVEKCLKCKGKRTKTLCDNGMFQKEVFALPGCRHKWTGDQKN